MASVEVVVKAAKGVVALAFDGEGHLFLGAKGA